MGDSALTMEVVSFASIPLRLRFASMRHRACPPHSALPPWHGLALRCPDAFAAKSPRGRCREGPTREAKTRCCRGS